MKNLVLKIGLIFLVLCTVLPLEAQSPTSDTTSGFDMTGFPQWTKDLRRGEIVAFGSLPFTMFFSLFAMNSYRMATNDWDRRFAPWPFTAAGAVSKTQEEHLITLGAAIGGSIIIAVADHLIVRHRRNRQEQEIRALPTGTYIIIRHPIDEEIEVEGEAGLDRESENP